MATEGENLVVEKSEILSQLDAEMTVEELDNHMEALEVNDMITLRYSDANLYCAALRPKGKLIAEKNRQAAVVAASAEEETTEEVVNTVSAGVEFKKLALVCAGSSFLGGMIAAIVAFLIARFG